MRFFCSDQSVLFKTGDTNTDVISFMDVIISDILPLKWAYSSGLS